MPNDKNLNPVLMLLVIVLLAFFLGSLPLAALVKWLTVQFKSIW